jgi:carbon-monoxide dehydrogenase small subunit
MSNRYPIVVRVNGKTIETDVPARLSLADWIRNELRLTGTHLGCEHGACGACTVLLDGRSVRSCILLAVQADGSEILTVEGLGNDELSELQAAFSRHHALQCGFCTPGFLMTATDYISGGGSPDPSAIQDFLAGNLCRCTGYESIVRAVADVAGRSENP